MNFVAVIGTLKRVEGDRTPPDDAETPDYVPPGRQETRLDCSWHVRYLEKLEESGGQKCAACKAVGVSLKTLSKHRNTLQAFEDAERAVLKLSLDCAESEAIRRATDGVESIYRYPDSAPPGATRCTGKRGRRGRLVLGASLSAKTDALTNGETRFTDQTDSATVATIEPAREFPQQDVAELFFVCGPQKKAGDHVTGHRGITRPPARTAAAIFVFAGAN